MLDIIRNRAQSFGIKLIFGIIILVFVFWGVGNFGGAPAGSLAVVNGESITIQDFSKRFQRILEAEKKRNPEVTGSPEQINALKHQVLSQVILSRLQQQEAKKLGLVISPHELKRVIASFPVFQNSEGKFDPAVYKRVLSSQGVSEGEFEAEYRDMLLEEKLLRYISMSVDVSEAEAKAFYDFSLEKRIAEYVLFRSADYKDKAEVSNEEVEQYYASNKAQYTKPAMVNLEFLALTPASLASGYPVTDQEAEAYYEANKLSFFQPEQFHVRHIFIPCPQDAADQPDVKAAVDKARELANEIAAKLRQGGDFAALAAEYSQDQLSAANGGDLGWISKGQLGSEEFDEAALALKAGSISEPVRSDYGFHLIKLEDKRAAATPPFADVKKDIVAELGKQKADAEFAEVEKKADEALALGTPFAELAQQFQVAAVQTGLVKQDEAEAQLALHKDSRQVLLDAIAGLAASPAGEATSAPVTIPVTLTIPDGIALVRVLEAKAAAIPPLEEVREAIVEQIKGNKGMALARSAAEEALPAFSGKETPAGFEGKLQESQGVVRSFPMVMPLGEVPELVEALFTSSEEWLPRTFYCLEGAVIARTKSIEPASESEWQKMKTMFMAQLKNSRQREALNAFMRTMVDSSDIKESRELLDKLVLR